MNDTRPLSADQIDELLSAELDGEFDAAAHDIGLDPADARARLATVPGVEARRAAFVSARDALAVPPAVDELVAARVRAKAMRAAAAEHEVHHASRTHRARRLATIAGGLAAAVAVVAGVAIALQGTNGTSKKSSGAPAAQSPNARPDASSAAVPAAGGQAPSGEIAFGPVSDVPALIARARATMSYATSKSADKVVGNLSGQSAPREQFNLTSPCAETATQVSGVPTPTVRGTATLAGTPVRVYLFRKGTDDIAVILRTDCRLVTKQTSPAPSG